MSIGSISSSFPAYSPPTQAPVSSKRPSTVSQAEGAKISVPPDVKAANKNLLQSVNRYLEAGGNYKGISFQADMKLPVDGVLRSNVTVKAEPERTRAGNNQTSVSLTFQTTSPPPGSYAGKLDGVVVGPDTPSTASSLKRNIKYLPLVQQATKLFDEATEKLRANAPAATPGSKAITR